MAFGFGFNKQKVLSAAEKYVQQGKLQNAITEYEKILKNDAKDLTVTNTVGDLYARLGDNDKATDCFKNVGDAYASQGFTVKAIAMYKKISKLKPSLENLLKLAELYTQQGLFNDARAQYLQVAEEFLKAGELDNAVRIFQKILEMDPENTAMRVRLAEVYVRLGKKKEAWEIFTAAAESMRSRGSLTGAEEVLRRMLTLDPGNTYALTMQARNLLESGDAEAAITSLEKIADLDSNPEGLRDLLKAYLQTGRLSDAGTVANKLLTVHNDLSAIAGLADALMQAGQYENALQVYDQHAERLLAENPEKVLEHLHTIIGHVRENPASLEKLLDLFQKAGENTHIGEVTELLAHASVQSGDLLRARDLYQKLASIEPQNPLHMQNYQQVVSQMGESGGGRLITAEEAAVIVDELEATAPAIHQHYSDEVALAVRSALTDAELFISYNMPAKALGPLIAALPQAPDDLRLNQRLAGLHTRAGRFAEAAVCCRTLQRIYSDAGYPEEASRYGDLADRYEERSAKPESAISPRVSAPRAAAAHVEQEASPEFAIQAPEEEAITIEEEVPAGESASPWPAAEPAAHEATEFAVTQEPAADSVPAEIDLSSEWEDSVTVEDGAPAEISAAAAPQVDVAGEDPRVAETIEEIRFYVGHGMPDQAWAGLAKLQTLTGDAEKLAQVRAEIEAATAAVEEEAPSAEPVEEITIEEEAPAAEFAVEEAAPEMPSAAMEELVSAADPVQPHEPVAEPAPIVEPVAAVEPEPVAEPESVAPAAVAHEPEEEKPGVLKHFVADLESELGDSFLPGAPAAAKPATHPQAAVPAAQAKVAAPVPAKDPVLGEFVADLEESVGEDFLKSAPVPAPAVPPAPTVEKKPAPVPPAPPRVAPPAPSALAATAPPVPGAPPLAASAAAAASVPHAAAPAMPSVSAVASAPHAQPPRAAVPVAPPSAKASPFGEDAGVDLAEMFGELKQDLEADVASADEDPETHYNLGIAFREMGLLDEAIGELQKACQSVDRGHPFPQVMQAYTWLAQCFLEKGVPEAAVRWYDKALAVPQIDGETRTALHYEIASAYETAGDKTSALKHFMDVYGSNIDYRDVSERINALKS